MWTELAVAFVQAARQPDTMAILRAGVYPETVAGLKRFVSERGLLPGTDKHYLDRVFSGKLGTEES
jgi:hypothetical protein